MVCRRNLLLVLNPLSQRVQKKLSERGVLFERGILDEK